MLNRLLVRVAVALTCVVGLQAWAAAPPAPAAAQSAVTPQKGTSVQAPTAVAPARALRPPRAMPVAPQIGIRLMYPASGTAVDFLFNAVPNATTYTLRRSASASGPYVTLTGGDVSLVLNNYVVNPPCCEIEDRNAYTVGVGQTVYYVIDAWSGTSLLMSSAVQRMDLPMWFSGPLNIDLEKTGANQWTIGWEPVATATSYLVWLQVNDGPINILYNPNVPANQTQLNVSGLQSGTRYRLYVSGSVMWNGTKASRDSTKYFTVQ